MSTEPEVTITVTLPAHYAQRLAVLADPDMGLPDVEAVLFELADHAQQGVYRPGAWERDWLRMAFGDRWTERLEPDDSPGMLSGDGRVIFDRPRAVQADGSGEEGRGGG